ncbi:hypothetical protein NKR19_g9493 [Coniochaeta hoffmannii]|uniref:HMG box domain-containing protein n=1 Tax=Coniochaeta hoffmannii TaxID=91930 RepID=A0AA38R3B2_9PEZI|nr:hypothetical protein NKR19_g9493 [Coniochaeta hoffmannii]
MDINTYVHRSKEERKQEVSLGKISGKLKRPMNAFMLYRKTYQDRAKEWSKSSQHSVVSQVCGESWRLEPDDVRAQFVQWAKIERDNHQKAHPSYKLTRSKAYKPKTKSVKGRRGEIDDNPDNIAVKDLDGHGSKPRRRIAALFGQHNSSIFYASNAGQAIPIEHDDNTGHCHSTMYIETTIAPMMHQPVHSETDECDQQRQKQQYHHYYHEHASFSRQRVFGTAGELLNLDPYAKYPHQVDPAPWHTGSAAIGQPPNRSVQTTRTATSEMSQYTMTWDEFNDPAMLALPRSFEQQTWPTIGNALVAGGNPGVGDPMEKDVDTTPTPHPGPPVLSKPRIRTPLSSGRRQHAETAASCTQAILSDHQRSRCTCTQVQGFEGLPSDLLAGSYMSFTFRVADYVSMEKWAEWLHRKSDSISDVKVVRRPQN